MTGERGRDELDRLVSVLEEVLTGLRDARADGAIPLVHPTLDDESSRPESRWAYMGECKYCGSDKPMLLFWRLTVTGPAQPADDRPGGPSAPARWWPWARCETCKHESEGKVTHTHDDP